MRPAYRHCVGTLLVALAPIALVAGCGSAYSKSDFVARADAVCTTAVRQLRSIPPPATATAVAPESGALAAYLGAVVPVVQSELSSLQSLRRPANEAGSHSALARWLAAFAQALQDYRGLEAAAQRGDPDAISSALAALQGNPVAALAAGYGLSSCATASATIR
ncbi:MAG: hypothetical protein ABSG43_12215 [Solirubrobacteraceae bacterium]|jgi:hypothetical protein